jgi:hypothetical protein
MLFYRKAVEKRSVFAFGQFQFLMPHIASDPKAQEFVAVGVGSLYRLLSN